MTFVETAAAEQFSGAGNAPAPLEVPEAVMPLACAAEFDTVYVGVVAFTYIVKATAHAFRGGYDITGDPLAEGANPVSPDHMSAAALINVRGAALRGL